jgi:hypothetical protein
MDRHPGIRFDGVYLDGRPDPDEREQPDIVPPMYRRRQQAVATAYEKCAAHLGRVTADPPGQVAAVLSRVAAEFRRWAEEARR